MMFTPYITTVLCQTPQEKKKIPENASGGKRHKFQIIDYTQGSEQAETIQKGSLPSDSGNQGQLLPAGEKEQDLAGAFCWHQLRRRERMAERELGKEAGSGELRLQQCRDPQHGAGSIWELPHLQGQILHKATAKCLRNGKLELKNRFRGECICLYKQNRSAFPFPAVSKTHSKTHSNSEHSFC